MADTKRKDYAEINPNQKGSVTHVVGKEGTKVVKGLHLGKAIAVFTSGGDAQGRPSSDNGCCVYPCCLSCLSSPYPSVKLIPSVIFRCCSLYRLIVLSSQ